MKLVQKLCLSFLVLLTGKPSFKPIVMLICPRTCVHAAGGLFGLYVALTGERSPGGSVAMAEGNALGKGPVIFHLYDSGIAYIRQRAAGTFPADRMKNGRLAANTAATAACVSLS